MRGVYSDTTSRRDPNRIQTTQHFQLLGRGQGQHAPLALNQLIPAPATLNHADGPLALVLGDALRK